MLYDLLSAAVTRFGGRDFIVSGERRFSFLDLDRMAGGVCAHLMDSGLQPGDRVLLLWDNGPEYAALFFGVIRAGGVVVPLNPANYENKVKTIASHCSARFVAATGRAIDQIRGWWKGPPIISEFETPGTTISIQSIISRVSHSREVSLPKGSPTDLAMILYTSGTTGKPKGVMLSHQNLVVNTQSTLSYLPLTEFDRTLAILPFYYSYGNSLLLTHAAAGAALVVENRFAFVNQALNTMKAEQVTGFSGVPSHYAVLFNHSNFLTQEWPYLRYLTCAGGGLPIVHIRLLTERLPATKLYLMYGQTEGGPRLSSLDPCLVDKKIGSIGKGIPGVDLRVVDEFENDIKTGDIGMVIAKGENIMLGYLADPEGTAEVLKNGWLYTGDLATVDDEGFIYIKGRSVEFIKSGGYRISPKEIEEIILQHPSVLECAVVGQPDDILGECVVAMIVPRRQADDEDIIGVLSAHISGKLPLYMTPRKYLLIDSIPKTDTGKIKRFELKNHV